VQSQKQWERLTRKKEGFMDRPVEEEEGGEEEEEEEDGAEVK
jgi:hypothetical protein